MVHDELEKKWEEMVLAYVR